jgi:hypothetical protein
MILAMMNCSYQKQERLNKHSKSRALPSLSALLPGSNKHRQERKKAPYHSQGIGIFDSWQPSKHTYCDEKGYYIRIEDALSVTLCGISVLILNKEDTDAAEEDICT